MKGAALCAQQRFKYLLKYALTLFPNLRATERYQIAGYDIDGYAEPTPVYDSFETAMEQFLSLHEFVRPVSAPAEDAGLFSQNEGAKS